MESKPVPTPYSRSQSTIALGDKESGYINIDRGEQDIFVFSRDWSQISKSAKNIMLMHRANNRNTELLKAFRYKEHFVQKYEQQF